ncbi:Bardet-Biedl syndrome 10 protein-like protein [Bienertia sinuspersici]
MRFRNSEEVESVNTEFLLSGLQDGGLFGRWNRRAFYAINRVNTQHNSLAIYILMRAAVLASRCGIKSKRFGRICKPLILGSRRYLPRVSFFLPNFVSIPNSILGNYDVNQVIDHIG